MFGYLSASEQELTAEERKRYQAHYCGICCAIGRRCGQRCRVALNHDLVFLALLHGSLYEPPEEKDAARCVMHPLRSHSFMRTSCTDYAANLNVALAYHKLLDDWRDDKSAPARLGASAIGAPYRRIRERLPRQCEAIERGLDAISEVERTPDAPPDDAAALFGRIMGELFVDDPESAWAADLYALGERLGRFIYLMDALCDLEQDRKRGSYNPLSGIQNASEVALPALQTLAGQAVGVFEKLPLERDLHLLRNVLYAGIWSKWNARQTRAHTTRKGEDR